MGPNTRIFAKYSNSKLLVYYLIYGGEKFYMTEKILPKTV